MKLRDHNKAITAIRKDYEERLSRACNQYDAARESLEVEHSLRAHAVSLLNHPILLDLFGRIEDAGDTQVGQLWPLVKMWVELRDETIDDEETDDE